MSDCGTLYSPDKGILAKDLVGVYSEWGHSILNDSATLLRSSLLARRYTTRVDYADFLKCSSM